MKASKSDILAKRGEVLDAVEAYRKAAILDNQERTQGSAKSADSAKSDLVQRLDDLLRAVRGRERKTANGTVIQSPLGKHVWEGGKWTCECYGSHTHECPNYNPRSYLSL